MIALAARIKEELLKLRPCPSSEATRSIIAYATEGAKLERIIAALEMLRGDEDLCRSARQAIARALQTARLALASMSSTAVRGGSSGGGGPPTVAIIGFGLGATGGGGGPGYKAD